MKIRELLKTVTRRLPRPAKGSDRALRAAEESAPSSWYPSQQDERPS